MLRGTLAVTRGGDVLRNFDEDREFSTPSLDRMARMVGLSDPTCERLIGEPL